MGCSCCYYLFLLQTVLDDEITTVQHIQLKQGQRCKKRAESMLVDQRMTRNPQASQNTCFHFFLTKIRDHSESTQENLENNKNNRIQLSHTQYNTVHKAFRWSKIFSSGAPATLLDPFEAVENKVFQTIGISRQEADSQGLSLLSWQQLGSAIF